MNLVKKYMKYGLFVLGSFLAFLSLNIGGSNDRVRGQIPPMVPNIAHADTLPTSDSDPDGGGDPGGC